MIPTLKAMSDRISEIDTVKFARSMDIIYKIDGVEECLELGDEDLISALDNIGLITLKNGMVIDWDDNGRRVEPVDFLHNYDPREEDIRDIIILHETKKEDREREEAEKQAATRRTMNTATARIMGIKKAI